MTEITEEQREAYSEVVAESLTFAAAWSMIAPLLPPELTNPQPVLPTEPGIYADKDRSPWHSEGGVWWFGSRDRHPESDPEDAKHIQSFAPFTRLVPERPQIARKEIEDILRDYHAEQEAGLVHRLLALVNGTDRD